MTLAPEAAEERLLRELEAYEDDLEGLTEAEYDDPEQFGDSLVNNLPTIAYALSSGMPVTAWRPAVKNSTEADRVLRAVRQWEEAARRLLAALAAGRISADQFREQMVEAYRRQARNSYIAGRRAMGDLEAPLDYQLAVLDELTADDEEALDAYLSAPIVGGGLGSLIAAMVLDPTNYLGSGLPGDPWAEYPPPLGNGPSFDTKAKKALERFTKTGKAVDQKLVAQAERTAARLVANGRKVPEHIAKLAGRVLDDPANATAQLAGFNKRVDTMGDAIRSYSHAGEMSALTQAIPGDATLVWWTMSAADHCIDCVRLSDGSPYYASQFAANGITPGSGHTRCGGRCRCHLEYDVPAEVCTDPLSGPGNLGDLTESADGRRLNVWVQEAASCANPMSIDALANQVAPELLDDAAAFSWDDDLGSAIRGVLDDSVSMDDIEDVAQGVASKAVRSSVIKTVKGEAKGFAKQADWLRTAAPGPVGSIRVARYEAEGSVYHLWWAQTADAIRFELGATTSGLPILDADFTLRAISDLADRARELGLRLEINGATASDGLKRWLDTIGAGQALQGGIPPTVLPDFRQAAALADRGIAPRVVLPGLDDAIERTAARAPSGELTPPKLDTHMGFISRQGRPDMKQVDGKWVEVPKSRAVQDRYATPQSGPANGYRTFPPGSFGGKAQTNTFVVAYDADGNAVASVSIWVKGKEVSGVAVRPDAARQGWATKLYDYVQDQQGINLYEMVGKEMTPDGKAFVTRWLDHRTLIDNPPRAGIAPAPFTPAPHPDYVHPGETASGKLNFERQIHQAALDSTVEVIAKDAGLTVEETTARLQALADTLTANSEVRVRVKMTVLDDILRDGRMKSRWETNTSGGTLDEDLRNRAESFIGTDAGAADRPIYGYLADSGGEPLIDGEYQMSKYGGAVIRLKPEARNRVTFFADDTVELVDYAAPSWPVGGPSWLDEPRYDSLFGLPVRMKGLPRDVEGAIPETKFDARGYAIEQERPVVHHAGTILDAKVWNDVVDGYPEAHIHGGLTLDDIAELVIPTGQMPEAEMAAITAKWAERGIPVRFTRTFDTEPATLVRDAPKAGIAPLVARTAEERALLERVGHFERLTDKPMRATDQYLMTRGRFFDVSPEKPPQGMGKPQFCTYNVGRAVAAGLPDGWRVAFGQWAQGSGHTWLVDDLGRAVDPTPYRGTGTPPRLGVTLSPDEAKKYLVKQDAENALETGSEWNFAFHQALEDLAEGPRAGIAPEVAALPDLPDLKSLKETTNGLAGANPKEVHVDPTGQEWLWKPDEVSGPWWEAQDTSFADRAQSVSEIGQAIGVRTPPVRAVLWDNRSGTLQPLLRELDGGHVAYGPAPLANPEHAEEMVGQHLFDYLVLNMDNHDGNIVVDSLGRLWGVDKDDAILSAPSGYSAKLFMDRSVDTISGAFTKTTFLEQVRPQWFGRWLDAIEQTDLTPHMAKWTDAQRASVRARQVGMREEHRLLMVDYVERAIARGDDIPPEWRQWYEGAQEFPSTPKPGKKPLPVPDPSIRTHTLAEVNDLPGWPDAGRLKAVPGMGAVTGKNAAKNKLGGWAPKVVVRDPSGAQFLLKQEVPDAEVAGAALSHALGLRVPGARRVEWDGQTWSMQPMVPGTESLSARKHGTGKAFEEVLTDAQLRDMARRGILDFVIANNDTHAGNWLIDAEGHIWGIDNGMAFKGAVASSPNVETFWQTDLLWDEGGDIKAANGVFGRVMMAEDAGGFFRRTVPSDMAEVLDRLDAMSAAEFERLAGEAVDLVQSPFATRADKLAALLDRKEKARAGYADWFRRRIEAMPKGEVNAEWRAWAKAGGTFEVPLSVPVPAGQPAYVAKAMPKATPLPDAIAATAKGPSEVGNDLGLWHVGFVPASTKAEVLERLTTLLPNTKGNVLDGFTLGQLNTILDRAEVMSEAGIDLTLLKRLGDFTRVPDADRALGIGLTYGDKVALDHTFLWQYTHGVDSPDTVYNDIGGLFAHEYGHVLFNRLGFDLQTEAINLYERVGGDAAALSNYAMKDVEEWFGEVVAAITTPGYTPGTVPFDGEFWSILAADKKATAMGADLLPAPSAKVAPKQPYPDVRKSIANGPYGDVTEMVPTANLLKYREYDRSAVITPNDPDYIDIKKNGIKTPLELEVSIADQTALLTEGNHRLVIAQMLGIEWVPVRGVRRQGSFAADQVPKAKPVKLEVDAYGYAPADLPPSRFLPAEDRELPAVPTEPVGPPKELPEGKKPWFKPGDPQQYLVADSPLPVNAPLTDWSGYIPPEPSIPTELLKAPPAELAVAKAKAEATYKDWHDIIDGTVTVAFSKGKASDEAAVAAGLHVEKVGTEYLVARGPSDLDAIRAFFATGGSANSDAYWSLVGYSPADLDIIDAYENMKHGLRLTGGVIMVEPDGRLWLMAPRNEYAGYQNTHIKGGVDAGEASAAAAAVREMREEAGFSVELDAFLGDYVNTDKTGLTRFYIGHRTGGGPLWAHQKETYEVRLVTADEAKGLLTRHKQPDARDQQVLADVVTALNGGVPTPSYVIPADSVAELAAKTQPLEQSAVWFPPPKTYSPYKPSIDPKAGIAPGIPDPPVSTAFGFDHAAMKGYDHGPITPPGTSFPMYQTRIKLPDGQVQPFYWKLTPMPSPANPNPVQDRLFWANSKKQVVNPQLRFALHVNHILTLAEQVASAPGVTHIDVNADLLAQVPKLRELLVAAGAVQGSGKLVTIARDDFLKLADSVANNTPLGVAAPVVPAASIPPVPTTVGLSGADPSDVGETLASAAYKKPPDPDGINEVYWPTVDKTTRWTFDGTTLKVYPPSGAIKMSPTAYKALVASTLAHHAFVAKALGATNVHMTSDWFSTATLKHWKDLAIQYPDAGATTFGFVYTDPSALLTFADKVTVDLVDVAVPAPGMMYDFPLPDLTPAAPRTGLPWSPEQYEALKPTHIGHDLTWTDSHGYKGKVSYINDTPDVTIWDTVHYPITMSDAERRTIAGKTLVWFADAQELGLVSPTLMVPEEYLPKSVRTMLDDLGATTVGGPDGPQYKLSETMLAAFRDTVYQTQPPAHVILPGPISDFVDLVGANMMADTATVSPWHGMQAIEMDGWSATYDKVGSDFTIKAMVDNGAATEHIEAEVAALQLVMGSAMPDGRVIIEPGFLTSELRAFLLSNGGFEKAGRVVIPSTQLPNVSKALAAGSAPKAVPPAVVAPPPGQGNDILQLLSGAVEEKVPEGGGVSATMTATMYGQNVVRWRRLGNVLETHQLTDAVAFGGITDAELKAHILRMGQVMDDAPKVSGLRFTQATLNGVNTPPMTDLQKALLGKYGGVEYAGGIKLTREQTLAMRDDIMAEVKNATATPGMGKPAGKALYDPAVVAKNANPDGFDTLYTNDLTSAYGDDAVVAATHPSASSSLAHKPKDGSGTVVMWYLDHGASNTLGTPQVLNDLIAVGSNPVEDVLSVIGAILSETDAHHFLTIGPNVLEKAKGLKAALRAYSVESGESITILQNAQLLRALSSGHVLAKTLPASAAPVPVATPLHDALSVPPATTAAMTPDVQQLAQGFERVVYEQLVGPTLPGIKSTMGEPVAIKQRVSGVAVTVKAITGSPKVDDRVSAFLRHIITTGERLDANVGIAEVRVDYMALGQMPTAVKTMLVQAGGTLDNDYLRIGRSDLLTLRDNLAVEMGMVDSHAILATPPPTGAAGPQPSVVEATGAQQDLINVLVSQGPADKDVSAVGAAWDWYNDATTFVQFVGNDLHFTSVGATNGAAAMEALLAHLATTAKNPMGVVLEPGLWTTPEGKKLYGLLEKSGALIQSPNGFGVGGGESIKLNWQQLEMLGKAITDGTPLPWLGDATGVVTSAVPDPKLSAQFGYDAAVSPHFGFSHPDWMDVSGDHDLIWTDGSSKTLTIRHSWHDSGVGGNTMLVRLLSTTPPTGEDALIAHLTTITEWVGSAAPDHNIAVVKGATSKVDDLMLAAGAKTESVGGYNVWVLDMPQATDIATAFSNDTALGKALSGSVTAPPLPVPKDVAATVNLSDADAAKFLGQQFHDDVSDGAVTFDAFSATIDSPPAGSAGGVHWYTTDGPQGSGETVAAHLAILQASANYVVANPLTSGLYIHNPLPVIENLLVNDYGAVKPSAMVNVWLVDPDKAKALANDLGALEATWGPATLYTPPSAPPITVLGGWDLGLASGTGTHIMGGTIYTKSMPSGGTLVYEYAPGMPVIFKSYFGDEANAGADIAELVTWAKGTGTGVGFGPGSLVNTGIHDLDLVPGASNWTGGYSAPTGFYAGDLDAVIAKLTTPASVSGTPVSAAQYPAVYGFSPSVLNAIGVPTETQQAQGFFKYTWSGLPGVPSTAKLRASSTSVSVINVPGMDELVSTIDRLGAKVDAEPGLQNIRFMGKGIEAANPGATNLLTDFMAYPQGDYLVMSRTDFLAMRDALAKDLAGQGIPGSAAGLATPPVGAVSPPPQAVTPPPAAVTPPPKPAGLADTYGYTAPDWPKAQVTEKVVNETAITRVVDLGLPDGSVATFAEELQGKARIIRLRKVNAGTDGTAGALQAIRDIAGRMDAGTDAFLSKGKAERLLVDKKALAGLPGVEQMLKDSGAWKETKEYWVISGRTFDGNFGVWNDPLGDFVKQLEADTAPWMAAGPVVAPTPTYAPATPGGPIAGAVAAPKAPTPDFIYGYDAAAVAKLTPADGKDAALTTGQFSGQVKQTLEAGPVKGLYSVSSSGGRIGLFGIEVAPGASQFDTTNAAYAVLREMAQRGTLTPKGFFIKPEFYEAVPGLRQLILDAGGAEAHWSNIGEAVQMNPQQAQNLLNVLSSNTMAGVKPGFQSPADFMGYDITTAKTLFGSTPKPGPSPSRPHYDWTVGKAKVVVDGGINNGTASFRALRGGDKVSNPLAAVAHLNWLAEQGVNTIHVDSSVLADVSGLRQFLLSVGGKVKGDVVTLDGPAVDEMRRYLTKNALPQALGGKALPYSVLDATNANIDAVIEAIGHHTTVKGPVEHGRFIVGGNAVGTTYTRSSVNIHWTATDATTGGASVGEMRAASAAQFRAFANELAQNVGIKRLDVSLEMLKANPGLASVLRKYGATEVPGPDGYLSLDRGRVLKLRSDLEKEFAQLGQSTGTTNVVEQWAGIVSWPTADELVPAPTKKLAGQTPKALFRDAAGNEWLFKPGASGRGAVTDEAVAELARLLGLPVPPVRLYSLEVNGKVVEGSLQKMLPNAKGMKDVTALTPAQTEDMLRHSVLDWLTNNDDAHIDNWLIGEDGRLWSIDKTRSWTTLKTSHDVLDNASMGNNAANGTPPQMFAFWKAVQANPALLQKVHPSSVTAMLRTLERMPDDDFARLVRPVAELTQDKRYVGKVDQLVAEMVARKKSTATDIAAYFKKNIDDAVRKNPAAVPDEWKAWAKGGGVFNLNATPKDLWMERKAALDAKYGTWSPTQYKAILAKGQYREANKIIDEFVRGGLAKYSGDARVKGIASHGYSPHYIPLLIPDQQYKEWLDVQEWAVFNILLGGAPVPGSNGSASQLNDFRKMFDPETGLIRLVRGSDHFSDPKAGMVDWEKRGARVFSASHVSPPWGGTKYYFEVPPSQVISTQFTDIDSSHGSEREVTVRDVRADQVYRAIRGSLTQAEQKAHKGGPVIQ